MTLNKVNSIIVLLIIAFPLFTSGTAPEAFAQETTADDPSLVPGSNAPSMGGVADKPLSVDAGSHVVIMEYEAWFGPKTGITFQSAEAMPVEQSADMQGPWGGGYDSTDPKVIRQHVQWMQYMGVDAALVDVTNSVGCIFSTGPISSKFCAPGTNESFRESNQNILYQTVNLYGAWSNLKTPLKLIPLLGCLNILDVEKDANGLSGIQKEAQYFDSYMQKYPDLSVLYSGHPLMLVYVGCPLDTDLSDGQFHALDAAKAQLHEIGFDTKYTIRYVTGYIDSQWNVWANENEFPKSPILVNPQYDLWSWIDRYKPAHNLYPSYNAGPWSPNTFAKHLRAENFTVSTATAGETGWGCPQPLYCPDDALRYQDSGSTYATFNSFFPLALDLDPVFLIVHQFNEFVGPDEGWNADASDDLEPTQGPTGWGYSGIQAVHDQILNYRNLTKSLDQPGPPGVVATSSSSQT